MTDITAIKAQFDRLYADLTALLRQGDAIEAAQIQLDEREHRLRDIEKALDSRDRAHEEKVKKFYEEKLYVARYLKQVKEKELSVERREAQLPDIKKMELEADERVKIARREEDRVEEKKKELADLQAKAEELFALQRALEREKVIDRERKQILDIREQQINKEKERLKRLSGLT